MLSHDLLKHDLLNVSTLAVRLWFTTFLAVIPLTTQATWERLPLFGEHQEGATWRLPDGTQVAPVPALYKGRPGLRLDAQLRRQGERFSMETHTRLDLSRTTEIAFDMRVSNPDAISRGTLYFRSGDGWYGGWFDVNRETWQTIRLPRSAFSSEGTPQGWDRIDKVRLALWKAAPARVHLEFGGLRGQSSPVLILKNTHAEQQSPNEFPVVQRSVQRLEQWFERSGLRPGVVSDRDLEQNGISPETRLLLMPFNPALPVTSAEAIRHFVKAGGRLIVMYAIPDLLAPTLGVSVQKWMRPDPPDSFASMRFDVDKISGIPPFVRQESWNANLPETDSGDVLGTWISEDGTDRSLAAAVITDTGIFLGHVLTNVDRQQKMQMLLAMMSHIAPEVKPWIAQSLQTEAVRLFDLDDWQATSAYILETARRNRRTRTTRRTLRDIDRDQKNANTETIAAMTFESIYRHTSELRDRVRQAYAEAVSGPRITSELRGVWIHNASGIQGQSWDTTVRALRHQGFNTLFANHQWAGLAYYPSDILPVASAVRSRGDLLQQCLDASRREDIALHLWSVLWVLDNAPADFVELMRKEGRLMKNRHGATVTWLCPSHPENQQWTEAIIVEALSNYAVDGIHLDYVRYPDQDACYCQGCAQRFRSQTDHDAPNWPHDVTEGTAKRGFQQWRHEQITTTVSNLYHKAKAVNPAIQFSIAVWPEWPAVRDSIGQDWVQWSRDGIVDFVCPMNYVTTAEEAVRLFERQRRLAAPDVPIYPGIAPTTHHLTPENTIRQVDQLRRVGAPGFVLFELDHDLQQHHLPALRAGATSR